MGASADRPLDTSCVRCTGGDALVIVRGELDLASAKELKRVLGTPEAQGPTTVLDLRAVTFVDSSGLSAIVGGHQHANDRGERFVVAVAGAGQVQRLISLTGLDGLLELVDEPAEVIDVDTAAGSA